MVLYQPSYVYITPCKARTSAARSDSPAGTVGVAACATVFAVCVAVSASRAVEPPPKAKQAAMSAAKASVLSKLVNSCERLPQRTPRHCKTAKATATEDATNNSRPASAGKSTLAYSPMTSATAATVPHVESQSLHPTTKPGYSPRARRAKT